MRALARAPYRCFACGKRFIDEGPQHNFRKIGKHRSLAAYIGLRRRQRFKLMLLVLGFILVAVAFGFLSWVSYQLASQGVPGRRRL